MPHSSRSRARAVPRTSSWTRVKCVSVRPGLVLLGTYGAHRARHGLGAREDLYRPQSHSPSPGLCTPARCWQACASGTSWGGQGRSGYRSSLSRETRTLSRWQGIKRVDEPPHVESRCRGGELPQDAHGGCRPSDEPTLWLIRIQCDGRPFIDLAHTSTSDVIAPLLKISLGNYKN